VSCGNQCFHQLRRGILLNTRNGNAASAAKCHATHADFSFSADPRCQVVRFRQSTAAWEAFVFPGQGALARFVCPGRFSFIYYFKRHLAVRSACFRCGWPARANLQQLCLVTSCTGRACRHCPLRDPAGAQVFTPAPHVIRQHQKRHSRYAIIHPRAAAKNWAPKCCAQHRQMAGCSIRRRNSLDQHAQQAIINPVMSPVQQPVRNACPLRALVAAPHEVLVSACLHPGGGRECTFLRRRTGSFMVPGSRPIIGVPERSRSNGPPSCSGPDLQARSGAVFLDEGQQNRVPPLLAEQTLRRRRLSSERKR